MILLEDALISRTSKHNDINILQETGSSTTSVMSQNACTDSFSLKSHSHTVSDLTSGTLPVSMGGTGQTNLSSGAILLGNGTNAISSTSVLSVSKGGTGQSSLTSGAILLGNGTNGISSTSTLPISKRGTGSTSASGALSNLELAKESGNWTPSINASSVSYNSRNGYYERIGNIIYIFCYMVFSINDAGSDYAKVSRLPFTANSGLKVGFNLVDTGNLI